ncbi:MULTISPECIES: hypothetical protein [Comamonas]|uniref:Uncharacterized protein n=2 Tax=Comamonas TaxID=283 RepID=A0A843B5E9_9BURK|nr:MULTISPECIES: hypothetical protein [Comamonas]AIJ45073.1 hypothetical protein O987_04540 [Comamonas testosteroni TK102]MBI1625903.1 hypothetical protein [Comamonas suwonensis]MPS88255.1 hypothetical protein [Comamonas sp.]
MNVQSFNPNPCFLIGLNSSGNLAFRRHHRMQMLQRLLPVLLGMLGAQRLADVSRDLELLYWPVLGHSRSPCFFEVPAFLGSAMPDQPMEPALVVERLMAEPCPPLPVDVAPAARNLERLRKHLDLSLAQSLRLLCAYLNYGGAAWPCFELPVPALHALLAAWWGVDLAAVEVALDERLTLLGLLDRHEPCDANTDLKSLLGIWPATVQALSLSHATDAELFAALELSV